MNQSEQSLRKFRLVTDSQEHDLEFRSVREAIIRTLPMADLDHVKLYKVNDDASEVLLYDSELDRHCGNNIDAILAQREKGGVI